MGPEDNPRQCGSPVQYLRGRADDHLANVHHSLEQLCLAAGMAAFALMLEQDAEGGAAVDLGVTVQMRGHPAVDVHGPHGRLHGQRPLSVPPPGERRSGGFGSGPHQV